MRKRSVILVLLLLLSGCAGGAEQAYSEKTAEALLDSGAFSEKLEPLATDLIAGLYGLDPVPESAVAYASTGATAEEVVVLQYADKDGADAGLAALQQRVAAQKEACKGYLPLELPKLEKAKVLVAGNTVLLVVAADYEKADEALRPS